MKRILVLLIMVMAAGARAQDLPPYDEHRKLLEDRMRADKALAAIMRINSVTFDYSEKKVIDGQLIRVAHYRVNTTLVAPACVMARVGSIWTFTSDARLCDRTFPRLQNGSYAVDAVWIQTDQGWRLKRTGFIDRLPSG